MLSTTKYRGTYLINDEKSIDDNSENEDDDYLSLEDINVALNASENDISNPIYSYDEVEEMCNIDSENISEGLTLDY